MQDLSDKAKYLNLNLKNNIIINKKNKEIDILDNQLNELSSNKSNEKINDKTNKFICNKCNLNFGDKLSLEKHNWSKHPTNEYETYHSNITDWSNLPMAYRDDPYY